jgi:general secretion pathway protein J
MRRARGFTLLELLIAIAIFSVVGVLAHGGLQAVLRAHERTEAVVADLDALRRTWLLLDQDLAALTARGIRDGSGRLRPAFLLAPGRIEFTRLHPGDDLPQRIEYRLLERRWMRFEWPVGDLSPAAEPASGVVLEEVEVADLTAFTEGGWVSDWPSAGQEATAAGAVPRAVTLRLVWRGHVLRWLFSVSA